MRGPRPYVGQHAQEGVLVDENQRRVQRRHGDRVAAQEDANSGSLPRRDGVAPALLSLAVLTLALTELSAALLHS